MKGNVIAEVINLSKSNKFIFVNIIKKYCIKPEKVDIERKLINEIFHLFFGILKLCFAFK